MQEYLKDSQRTAYIGFDPTSDSLHIGSLVPIILLAHFQKSGHQPIALVGGATGMIGDPSGKSVERNLLDEETLRNNENGIRKQLSRVLQATFSDRSGPYVEGICPGHKLGIDINRRQ